MNRSNFSLLKISPIPQAVTSSQEHPTYIQGSDEYVQGADGVMYDKQARMPNAYFDALSSGKNNGEITVEDRHGQWQRQPDGSITINYQNLHGIQTQQVTLNDIGVNIKDRYVDKNESSASQEIERQYDGNGFLKQKNTSLDNGSIEENFDKGRPTISDFHHTENTNDGGSLSRMRHTVFDNKGQVLSEVNNNTNNLSNGDSTSDEFKIEGMMAQRSLTQTFKSMEGDGGYSQIEFQTDESWEKGIHTYYQHRSTQSDFDAQGSNIRNSNATETRNFDEEGQLLYSVTNGTENFSNGDSSESKNELTRQDDGNFARSYNKTMWREGKNTSIELNTVEPAGSGERMMGALSDLNVGIMSAISGTIRIVNNDGSSVTYTFTDGKWVDEDGKPLASITSGGVKGKKQEFIFAELYKNQRGNLLQPQA